ncbi:hypothetical protein BJV77DRAFT_1009765 [Russula vinacea]|nr:hypothetical protein BJV77DRAFT_1009765 [Russula vinacea]
MTDVIVKIMIEILSILAIATKQIKQGRSKKFLKKLLGKNDIEDALKKLDTLTLEEARMAIAETLNVTNRVDDKVDKMDNKVDKVDDTVHMVDDTVNRVDDKVTVLIDGGKRARNCKSGSLLRIPP